MRTFFGPCRIFDSSHTLVLQRREAAREDALTDQRDGLAQVERGDRRPLAGSLLSGRVEDLVDHRLAVVVLLGEDLGRDLDQVAVKFALVPFGEDLTATRRRS